MAQYPIPQFIEKQGKIVFFLTFRQFFLLVISGGICFLVLYTLPFFLFLVLAIPIMGAAAAIAFVKIEKEPILKVLLHFVGFSMRKKNYVWEKKDAMPITKIQPKVEVSSIKPEHPGLQLRPGKLEAIKKMIETKK